MLHSTIIKIIISHYYIILSNKHNTFRLVLFKKSSYNRVIYDKNYLVMLKIHDKGDIIILIAKIINNSDCMNIHILLPSYLDSSNRLLSCKTKLIKTILNNAFLCYKKDFYSLFTSDFSL